MRTENIYYLYNELLKKCKTLQHLFFVIIIITVLLHCVYTITHTITSPAAL